MQSTHTSTKLTLLTRPLPTPIRTDFLPVHFADPLLATPTSITMPASPTAGWITGMPTPLTKTDPELDLASVGLAGVEAYFLEGENEEDMQDYYEAVDRDDGKRNTAGRRRVGWLLLGGMFALGIAVAAM